MRHQKRTISRGHKHYDVEEVERDGKKVVDVSIEGKRIRTYDVSDDVIEAANANDVDVIDQLVTIAESDITSGKIDELSNADTDPDPKKRKA